MNKDIELKVRALYKDNADKQLSLSVVFNTTVAALKSDKTVETTDKKTGEKVIKKVSQFGVGDLYYELVNANRKHSLQVFMDCMPWARMNGLKEHIVCDWTEMQPDKDSDLAIAEYKLSAGAKSVKPENPVAFVTDNRDMPKKEFVTYASGYKKEVNALDKEGKPMRENREVKLVPHKKTVWGYTDAVCDAFIAMLDELEQEETKKLAENSEEAAPAAENENVAEA